MASQIKILAYSPYGPALAYKSGTKALVYKVLESPADPPPETPPVTGSGYWFYYVNYYGSDSTVIYGAGANDVGYFTNTSSNKWIMPGGAEEGGTRWAQIRFVIEGGFSNPASPPRLYVTDSLPGYGEATFYRRVSWFGGSAISVNGDILMLMFWSGTLVWVPGS